MHLIRENILRFVLVYLLVAVNSLYAAQDSELQTCQEVKSLKITELGNVECLDAFHHYNSTASDVFYDEKVALKNKSVQIGSFNVFQAGSPKTEFKDFEIMAKIMNNFDVVSAVELVPLVGIFKSHNDSLIEYLKKENDLLEANLQLLPEEVEQKRNGLKLLLEQYELPGYVRILIELRKLDKSWSLILTPTAEGTETSTIKELSGFYYRAKIVRPIENEYCQTKFKSIACYANFDQEFYGREINDLISRRPLIGSFQSGHFDFTLLSVHTIYNAPSNEELRTRILEEAFGVSSTKDLPKGLRADTYARFAEVKHILEFTTKLKKKFLEKDIFILGDFNLKSTEAYWPEAIGADSNMKVYIDEPTSVANARLLSDGTVTNGTTNNYDHFIFDESEARECGKNPNPKVYNFLENSMRDLMDARYLIRSEETYVDEETDLVMYYIHDDAEKLVEKRTKDYTKYLEGRLTVKRGELTPRYDVDVKLADFSRKLFDPQLYERTYYRYAKEIISDHLPVYLSCSNLADLD